LQASELAELSMFLGVARHKSFRKTALERGVASSAVSHAIRSLEERVAVRLFHRTTRSVSLTEAGEQLLVQLQPAFDQIERALETLNAFRETPFGTVRVNVPASIAPILVREMVKPLLERNPGLRLNIAATDSLVDIVAEGFDAGIRFGERLGQNMIAVRIKPVLRFAVVGAPSYFATRDIPLTPEDLRRHECIRYRYPSGAMYNWQFERDGQTLDVEVEGPLTVDSQELMVEAALRGCGIAYVWDYRVSSHLASGALVRCLDDWCVFDDSLFLYYPSRRHVSAGLRALIEFLRAKAF
jgi:DNA-binding transcriptional LysR family regulator